MSPGNHDEVSFMTDPVLYIGNKNYSSWSFRPWIGMRAAGIAFEEKLVPFDMGAGNPAFRVFSPTGKVPVLVDGDADHLGIAGDPRSCRPQASSIRTLACRPLRPQPGDGHEFGDGVILHGPELGLPDEHAPRAQAIKVTRPFAKDVARIQSLWSGCLENSGGPFLFGTFSIADAMFAPVVNRLDVYAFETQPES
jgi:glutathione S-transferase